MTIEVQHLTKIYGTQKAVDDISFSITKGEIVGFLGPNGAGKSTTMKIIACYTLPTSGTVFVNNYDIFEHSLKLRQHIGYLPEQNPLYEDMYVREYLLFVCRLHKINKQASKKVEGMIELTGLGIEAHKKIGELSKGYKQRVGLAQSLIHDPQILILDEPTSGLDPNQVVDIRNLIKEIGKTRTIILSSHIMQEVQAMCNRVIIINKGTIVADNKTDILLSRFSNQLSLRVTFKNTVKKDELLSIKGVISVEQKEHQWLISSRDQDINENIFAFAVEKKNPVIEVVSESESLERIFQQLTTNS